MLCVQGHAKCAELNSLVVRVHPIVQNVAKFGKKKQAQEQGKEAELLGQLEAWINANGADLNILLIPEGKNIARMSVKEAVLEWQRKHKEGYNKISGQDIKKAQRRKEKKKICVYCGRVFSSSTPTNLCSEYCRKKNRQIKEYQAEIKRGKNVNIGRLLNEQKEYQSKVETNEIEKTI